MSIGGVLFVSSRNLRAREPGDAIECVALFLTVADVRFCQFLFMSRLECYATDGPAVAMPTTLIGSSAPSLSTKLRFLALVLQIPDSRFVPS